MELTDDVRKRLRAAMEAKKETGYTINAKTGISATTVGNYINEDSRIKKADNTKLQVICNLLEIDYSWLETGVANLVKSPEDSLPEESLPEVAEKELTTEAILKQILLKMSSKDDQFSFIHKEMHSFREAVMKKIETMGEEIVSLKKEFKKLKKE